MIDKILMKEIINPICYIVIGICVYLLISNIIKRASNFKIKGQNNRKKKTIISLINNIIKYIIAIVVILMILEVYNVNTSAILASLGVVGVVIGLALQDLIKDFIAGIFIIFDDQYSVGDTVTINAFRGEVVALGLKSTKLKSIQGDIMSISNGQIKEVINHSLENSLALVEVDVAYEENLDHVLSILEDECEKFSKTEKNLCGKFNILGVTDLGASGVRIRVTVETLPLEQFQVERDLRKAIKNRFDQEHIEIPFTQVVVHSERV